MKPYDLQVADDKKKLFEKILDVDRSTLNLPLPFFTHAKRYRQIKGYEILGGRFYIKEYFDCFSEGEKEWENIFTLRSAGFLLPEPFFLKKSPEKIEIATFELRGVPLSELLQKDKDRRERLIIHLAELIANLHLKGFYHQDCYLNHFYWDEEKGKLGFLDVARVKHYPPFSFKYRIKDLAQLGYSFEKYLGPDAPSAFNTFLSQYYEFSKFKWSSLLKPLVTFKAWLIRRRTTKAKKRGKPL